MKRIFLILGVLAGLLILAGVAVVFLVDVNAHKPRIEAAASDGLGMEFRIQGKAGLRLFPSAGIALSEIRIRNRGAERASAETLRVGVKLLPLLLREVEVTEILLEKPALRIEKGADGKLSYESPPRPKKPPATGGEATPAPLAVSGAAAALGLALRAAGAAPLLTAPVFVLAVITGGWYWARRAWSSLRLRSLDINALMLLAVAGAAAIGEYSHS